MKTLSESLTDSKHKTVFIKRTFDLPIDTVWKAWTECESLKKWWGPKNYTCPFCVIDLQEGGKFRASMKEKTGKQTETFSTGTYLEIVPQSRLVVTDSFSDSDGNITPPPAGMPGEWFPELLVTLEMSENDGKTDFSLRHEGLPVEAYEDCISGWQECLDKLETNLK